MNRLRDILRAFLDEAVLFYGYRWFAWFIAAVSLALPSFKGSLASETWLLALTFMFNLMVTALASSYVRVARVRPALLIFDVLASVALVWASGGAALPFLPYAFGALVLPALLLPQIRNALPFAVAFALLDQIAPWITPPDPTTSTVAPDMAAVAVRVAAPFVFVLLAQLVGAARSPSCTLPGAAHTNRSRPAAPGASQPTTCPCPRCPWYAPGLAAHGRPPHC